MLNFKQLSDEELEEYLGNFEETKENNEKEEYLQDLRDVQKKLELYHKSISSIQELIKENNLELAYRKCHETGMKLSKESIFLNKLPWLYGEKNGLDVIKRDYIENKHVIFSYEKDKLCVKLSELLPHKPQYDVSTGEMRYFYDIDVFRTSYYEVFLKEFMNGKYKMFDCKVVIIYKHHFKNLEKAPDPDNIDTKPMTDIITTFVLRDDSFPYCSQYHTAVEDEEEYTEIIIAKEDMIIKN